VGAAPRADAWVELRWEGEAELFVDGRSLGLRRGGHRDGIEPGAFRLYRIVRGRAWSGWIYVNAPGSGPGHRGGRRGAPRPCGRAWRSATALDPAPGPTGVRERRRTPASRRSSERSRRPCCKDGSLRTLPLSAVAPPPLQAPSRALSVC